MQFAGLDIHLRHINAYIMDKAGNIETERQIKNDPDAFHKFLAYLDKDKARIAVEACSCWEYIYDYLTDAGFNVILANPSQIALIGKSKKKTAKRDARVLANLLRVNMLPTAYAAPAFIRDHRQLSRHQASLSRLRAQIKNKINTILVRNGIVHEYSDVFGKAGKEYLRSLDLEMRDRYQVNNYLAIIDQLDKHIQETLQRIEELEIKNPNLKMIRSHPGFDYQLALTVDAEIGDIRRFEKYA